MEKKLDVGIDVGNYESLDIASKQMMEMNISQKVREALGSVKESKQILLGHTDIHYPVSLSTEEIRALVKKISVDTSASLHVLANIGLALHNIKERDNNIQIYLYTELFPHLIDNPDIAINLILIFARKHIKVDVVSFVSLIRAAAKSEYKRVYLVSSLQNMGVHLMARFMSILAEKIRYNQDEVERALKEWDMENLEKCADTLFLIYLDLDSVGKHIVDPYYRESFLNNIDKKKASLVRDVINKYNVGGRLSVVDIGKEEGILSLSDEIKTNSWHKDVVERDVEIAPSKKGFWRSVKFFLKRN
ncbi:MAG: hypothetical protein A2493_03550 [Candidatus Magasanikbacteria bacterium RIFOXYC12_FULL_33_11]|uniref:Uncharacterized protein n=1 Tax=Candidatus Magasanikbacteria bacterium RIFOXYC12_FULL_33_11 TaxID=1798701 RepID=A0A1F6NQY4_9BACT|nr:MAG: hypothetical protein A2493_03550 [Candidatus Magasanikbacteria bacterium RIFOXYC12_FULL_33_11]